MKRLLLAASLAVLCLSSSASFAHDRDRDHDRRGYHHHDHDDDDDHRHRHRHSSKHKGWKHKHRDYHRGERIEVVYMEPRYYVEDYRHYRLRQPPHGHRWVRTDDGRFILVAMATGIIADILLHH